MIAVHRTTLENGLRVLVTPTAHLQSASISLFIKVGSRYEQARTNGLSHFLEHMVFRGTEPHPTSYALNLATERIGGSLDAATYADFTEYTLELPRECVGEGIEVLGGMFTSPRFSEIELEKQIVREEILADLDEDGREIDADNLALRLMFGDDPLGFKITGDADNVATFQREDLVAHLRAHYVARNMVVCASGRVEIEPVVAAVREALGSLPPGSPTLLRRPPPLRHGPRFHFVSHKDSQSELRVCFRSFGEDDPDCVALEFLVRVLDDGMSTRLHRRMTDDSGLAYSAYASRDAYEDTGLVEIGASIEHNKALEALRAALSLLTAFRDQPVTDEELAIAKRRYRWELRDMHDDPGGLCDYFGTSCLFGRRASLERLEQQVERVDVAAIQAVARRVIRPENLYVVCVGKLTKAQQATLDAEIRGFR